MLESNSGNTFCSESFATYYYERFLKNQFGLTKFYEITEGCSEDITSIKNSLYLVDCTLRVELVAAQSEGHLH